MNIITTYYYIITSIYFEVKCKRNEVYAAKIFSQHNLQIIELLEDIYSSYITRICPSLRSSVKSNLNILFDISKQIQDLSLCE